MLMVMVAGLPGSGRSEAAAGLAGALAAGGQRTALLTMGGDPAAAPLRVDLPAEVTHHTTADGCVACHSGQALMRTLEGIYRAEQPDAVVLDLAPTALPDALRPYVGALEDVPVETIRVVITAAACGPALAHQQGLAFLFENMIRTADAVWLPEANACPEADLAAARAALLAVNGALEIAAGSPPETVARRAPGRA